jgi:hypothetical protein
VLLRFTNFSFFPKNMTFILIPDIPWIMPPRHPMLLRYNVRTEVRHLVC